MRLFEGLYIYEITLLLLGVLMFLLLLSVLTFYVIKSKSVKSLLGFFVVSIAMIGWPSIQQLEFSKDIIRITKQTSDVNNDPADSTARTALAQSLAKIEKRPASRPRTLLILSQAQATIGDTIKALTYAEKALSIDPGLTAAANFRKILDTPRIRVERDVIKLKQAPSDSATRKDLIRNLSQIERVPVKNLNTLMTIAKGKAEIGDTAEALLYLDSVQFHQPSLPEAINLRRNLIKR